MKKLFTLLTFYLCGQFLLAGGVEFIPNNGQLADSNGNLYPTIQYYTQFEGGKLYFLQQKLMYVFEQEIEGDKIRKARLNLEFVNANPTVQLEGSDPIETYYNYYFPHCPDGILNVHPQQKLTYKDLWAGIDLVFYNSPKGMKYDFIVHPGADPAQIQLRYHGAKYIGLNEEGQLEISHGLGTLIEDAPYVYQENTPIPAHFQLNDNILRFQLGNYDPTKELVIDPLLYWSTYYRFSVSADRISTSAANVNGDFFASGRVGSSNIDTALTQPGSYIQASRSGSSDLIILKISGDDLSLAWATYYGSTRHEYMERGLATLSNGGIYVGGYSSRYDLPLPPAPGSPAYYFIPTGFSSTTRTRAFILQFDSNGIREYGTFIEGAQKISDLAVDQNDNLIITGYEPETNFYTADLGSGAYFIPNPITSGESRSNAFIIRMRPNHEIEWATQLSFGAEEVGYRVSVDNNNNIFWAGEFDANSSNAFIPFGLNPGGGAYYYDTASPSDQDIILAKFTHQGVLTWATLIRGNDIDRLDEGDIQCDPNGNLFVTGTSQSTNIPTIAIGNAYRDSTYNGGASGDQDVVIFKFTNDGIMEWGTYFGGGNASSTGTDDVLRSIGFGPNCSYVYMGGYTQTTDISTLSLDSTIFDSLNVISPYGGGNDATNAFFVRFSNGGELQWASFFGGARNEQVTSLVVHEADSTQQQVFATMGNVTSENTSYPLRDPGNGAYFVDSKGSSSATVGGFVILKDTNCTDITPLPVEGMLLQAEAGQSAINLSWSTSHEINNAGFDIERSLDGRSFRKIGFQAGRGDFPARANYYYADGDVHSSQTYYYRLRQVDFDGNSSYSNVAIARLDEQWDAPIAVIYPNPTKDILNIKLQHANQLETILEVVDLTGKQMLLKQAETSSDILHLNVSSLPQGAYMLRIKAGNRSESHAFFKQ